MTETRAVSIEDVRTLVGERQRYDDWMAALEARRAETPARVFERVYGDYAARRGDVMEQLRSHVGTLAALADDLDGKLNALEQELSTLEDERVEAMLRTAVGEFDDARWEQVRQDVEAKIAERTAERGTLMVEVDDVRTLLSSARNEPPPAPEPVAASAPTAAAVASEEVLLSERVTDTNVTPVSSEVFGSIEAEQAQPVESGTLDIEDALAMFTPAPAAPVSAPVAIDTMGIEVIGNDAGAPGMSSAARPTATATPATNPVTGAETDPFDDLAFLRSVIDPAEGSRGAASSNGNQGGQNASQATSAPAAAGAASGESLKTLRCTECGTMNLPTEWYCERCGGELAAF